MSLDNTLLAEYHKLSKQIESGGLAQLSSEEAKEKTRQLSTANRELVSRCILADDQRGIIFLLDEIKLLLQVIGHHDAANAQQDIIQFLLVHFKKSGTIMNFAT